MLLSISTYILNFSISSLVILPGLNILTLLSITLTTVDSNPISTIPSSIIVETFPSNSFNISSILVPLGLPDTFALGAAIGTPAYSINLLAILFDRPKLL